MAYAMNVHTPLGIEKFLLDLPTEDNCGGAHMLKGSLDFTSFNKINETYVLSAFTEVPFSCLVRVQCTPSDETLTGVVEIGDSDTGEIMFSCPIDGQVSSNPHPWIDQHAAWSEKYKWRDQ